MATVKVQKGGRKVPKLRFSEFSEFGEEWEEKELGEVSERVTRKNKENNQNVLTISAQQGLVNQEEYFTKSVSAKNISGYYLLIKDEFAYNKSYSKGYPMGAIKRLNKYEKGVVSTLYICFRVKKNNSNVDFLEHYFDNGKINREISKIAQEGARAHGLLNMSINDFFSDIKLIIPSLHEQQKIANSLNAVDKWIENLKAQKENLEAYKKGMMQKIFNQEIRFKDDNGNDFSKWEEKRLGEVLIDYSLGGNYANSEIKTEYPLIKMGNLGRGRITLNKIEYIKNNENVGEEDQVKKNDLFFNTRNTLTLVGKVAIWRNELPIAYYNSNLMKLKFKCNEYMNYYLNSQDGLRSLKAIATGTTSVAAIYTRDLLKIKIKEPSLEEQRKIADFLTAIDNLIQAEQLQITKAELWEKGLMQKLFV